MALSQEFKISIKSRAARDASFRRARLQEGVECLLDGDTPTGKAVLRDYINATVGFETLAYDIGKSSKSLMRIFEPTGNPQASNLLAVIHYLKKQEGVSLKVTLRKVA